MLLRATPSYPCLPFLPHSLSISPKVPLVGPLPPWHTPPQTPVPCSSPSAALCLYHRIFLFRSFSPLCLPPYASLVSTVAMSPAVFKLGPLSLPPAESLLARSICNDARITSHSLYIKWEAWALRHHKSADAPSVEDLNALAAHIRASAAASKPAKRTPRPIVKPSSFVYAAEPTPTRVNVDDFFSYLDDDDDQARFHDPVNDPSSRGAERMDVDVKGRGALEENVEGMVVMGEAAREDEELELAGAAVGQPRAVVLEGDDEVDAAYAERQGSGRVEATFNTVEEASSSVGTVAVRVVSPGDRVARYMNDAVGEKIEAVRGRVREIGEAILARMRAMRGELPRVAAESFYVPSPDVVLAVGRVRVELDGSDGVTAGRINASSVVLESEDGNLVKLDLGRVHEQKLPVFLNPGMVVVVEGVNTNGRCLEVHAVYDNAMPIPGEERRRKVQVAAEDDEILPEGGQPEDQPFANVLFAAGPYTTGTNLKYEPLDDVLDVIKRSRPDVAMLAGPFVDAAHGQVSEKTPVPFEQIFETRIMAPLRQAVAVMAEDDAASGMNTAATRFVLVPSLADVHHDFVCPQPALQTLEGQASDPNILLLPNPSVVELTARGGACAATVGMCALPTLQDISADCLCWNKGDRFSAIVSNMLRQRSFYPSFPPTAAVPLDTSLMEGLVIPEVERSPTIDVLVVTSKLKPFIKSVDGGSIAVNPGLLCRGSSGGTYAELRVPLHEADRQRPLNANTDKLQGNIVRL